MLGVLGGKNLSNIKIYAGRKNHIIIIRDCEESGDKCRIALIKNMLSVATRILTRLQLCSWQSGLAAIKTEARSNVPAVYQIIPYRCLPWRPVKSGSDYIASDERPYNKLREIIKYATATANGAYFPQF